MLQSIHELARRFGGRVVAEGVERRRGPGGDPAIGIDLVQGYLFARAAPLGTLLESGLLGGERKPGRRRARRGGARLAPRRQKNGWSTSWLNLNVRVHPGRTLPSRS